MLLADGVLFGSLLFGYAFLWTVAPNWPPPSYLEAGLVGPLLFLAGAVVAPLGIRLAERRLRANGSPQLWLALGLAGLAAILAAGILVLMGLPRPDAHAYDATVWVVAGYVLSHAGLVGIMTVYLMARAAAGFLSARRLGEMRVVRLWADYLALVTLISAAAIHLPGMLG